MVGDVTEVRVRLRELEACDPISQPIRRLVSSINDSASPNELTGQGSRNLAHVLEVRPEVLAPGTRSCKRTAYHCQSPIPNCSLGLFGRTFLGVGREGGGGVTNCIPEGQGVSILAVTCTSIVSSYVPILKS